MSLVSVLLTSFALSMDAFAVSITKGMTMKNITKKIAFKIAFFFGLFQGGMPLIGWLLGISFEKYIKAFDHWIALILLSFLGVKMIYESIKENKKDEVAMDLEINGLNQNTSTVDIKTKDLLVLSVATSIDALAVGVSFAFLNISIIEVVTSIAIITFLVCFTGVLIGKKIGPILKNYAEIIGGIILIFIGLNIFNEHTGFISNFLDNIN
ncbi:manganese efflux pump MntP [Paraclostridium sordellii]|uniref:Putative manganese efflux pump MntP n=1 Tax=Paraclostridium sordellii TaxID=1505 RepID=A0A0C7PGA9_PARSO|nr:manganese efflux pump MntP family protein [Paeniclostridium sordellii]QYE96486.1 manganese efflux pump MntP family protein [Paeniclostridium sordellii]CEN78518.1 membrane protein [[Clostridium] sordellii] [Paeniclostridium sordellii]CEO08793.1 membrane protein [[Clostridium] sordellii] [Paeniclostridium sordellii]CEP87342.1 membrane protein [[Clostridium] sordellii] [Paeniclostridium sordellii]CEP95684.1 membrane protein [[Clostridium] sordellii] [Paeniclostridium sordellii]